MDSWIRQRAVARRLPAIMDLFTEHMTGSGAPEGQRLIAPSEKATDGAGVLRNAMRTYALGCAVRLGLDLGLHTTALFGRGERGRTEILELRPFHGGSVMQALANFDALRADRGEIGRLVDARYSVLLRSAEAEVEECLDRLAGAQAKALTMFVQERGRRDKSKNDAITST
jgi:hypothetical protein